MVWKCDCFKQSFSAIPCSFFFRIQLDDAVVGVYWMLVVARARLQTQTTPIHPNCTAIGIGIGDMFFSNCFHITSHNFSSVPLTQSLTNYMQWLCSRWKKQRFWSVKINKRTKKTLEFTLTFIPFLLRYFCECIL